MKNVAIYPGTFDPITYGHLDLIDRALKLFDHVIIAVAASPNKKPLFSVEERVQLIRKVCTHENISVYGFDCLLLDFAEKHQANIILRGLRTVTDFDYEFQLASMNRHMNPKIENVFLMPSEKFMSISSSFVREIALLKGDVKSFVPALISQALEEKYRG